MWERGWVVALKEDEREAINFMIHKGSLNVNKQNSTNFECFDKELARCFIKYHQTLPTLV